MINRKRIIVSLLTCFFLYCLTLQLEAGFSGFRQSATKANKDLKNIFTSHSEVTPDKSKSFKLESYKKMPYLKIEIGTPGDGSYMSNTPITVTGMVRISYFYTHQHAYFLPYKPKLIVKVNGVRARVKMSGHAAEAKFAATGIPLTEGDNRITASVYIYNGPYSQPFQYHILPYAKDEITVTLDTTLPELSITNPQEDSYTNQSQIDVSGTFNEINLDTITVNGVAATIAGNTFTAEGVPLDNEGDNPIFAEITDLVEQSDSHQINVIRDTTPPQNPSITINEDNYTNSITINLSLSAEGATEMIISEALDFTGADWEVYATGKVFTLTIGDGFKTVYAKFRDESQNETDFASDTIILDQTTPEIDITSPEDGSYTTQTQVDVSGTFTEINLDTITVNGIPATIEGTTFTAEGVPMEEGPNTITAVITDLAENQNTDEITAIRDIIALEIEINLPDDNFNTTKNLIKVWGTVNDNQAAVTVNGISALVGNNQFAAGEIPLRQGENIIIAEATDLSNNTASDQITVNLSSLPATQMLVDDFSDGQHDTNILGFWTGDNQSCTENADINGYHKISWDNDSSYWYSDLWNTTTLPEGTDISHYERLTFKIKGASGGENFSIELEDIPHGPDFNKRIEISDYTNLTTQWQEVTIPLKDFAVYGIWKSQVRSIVFNFNKTTAGTIYIDDLKFKPCLIDTFADDNPGTNSLGYTTGDDNSLAENIDIGGYHKLQWNDTDGYWYTDLWDGNGEFNAGGFKYISLRLRGEIGDENFSLELQDNQTADSVEIADYIDVDQSWDYIYIPLADFSVDRSSLQKLILNFNKQSAGTIFIDRIGITNTNNGSLAKFQSTGPVKIAGKQLLVNGAPFMVKGVGYQPTPIGTQPRNNQDLYQDPGLYNRDLPLLREMGCNTIRIWKKANSHDFLRACYNQSVNPIYVIMGFPIEYNNLGNTETRNLIKQEFMEYVLEYKDEPAVLVWALGNEINMTYAGNMSDWYSLANELAEIAYQIEGQNYHPVAIVNRDLEHIGEEAFYSTDDLLTHVDIWGMNAYRGLSYRGFFESYSQISAKPLLITEYGADSWHSGITPSQGHEDPDTQAEYYLNNWTEIKNAVGCAGGTLMEYTDEWWKVVGGNYDMQDYGGFQDRYDQPDNYSNEEFWGLFRVQDNGEEPDIIIAKRAYEVMELGFNNLSYPELTLAWEFNVNGDSEGWTPVDGLTGFTVEGGILHTEVTGPNPIMDSPDGLAINGLLYSGIEICMKVTGGMKAKFLWRKDGEVEFIEENNKEFLLFGDGNYHIYHIYLGNHPNWNESIVHLRLNPTSDSSGQIEIDYIRIVQGELPEDFTPPEDVTNLTAESGNEMVTLTWTASQNSEGDLADQLLYIDDGTGYSLPENLGCSVSSYEVTGLTNAVTYTFKITCIDEVLNESDGATIQAVPQDTTAPEDITDLTAVPGDGMVTLNWTASINGEGDLANQVLYIDSGSGYSEGQNLGPSAVSYIASSLNNGQLYKFKITCIDEVPNESAGAVAEAIPQPAQAPQIEISSPEDGCITGNTTITVSGTVDNDSAVVTVNGISATVTSGIFTANNVSLPNEEENQILAVAEYGGYTGQDVITVYRDTTSPELEITTPKDGEIVIGYP